ncbi:MAG: hypothetical protein HOA57_03410 [Candidatus Magasanikbacteria bacterium]|jgi:hypothetical protein|nr:hypothetical protein [Candidatus Magasanikbacteria bacterium]MBT4314757.1 hypothetical protein [Candidatus Magasanikbacteria bacterium]MBT4547534.1 hypothetical protein [Candidatus Magasanikbacteria bacterium]MBT6819400.1 hypothetical protein [Candidatus Magasanikbacteria bacterium]
MCYSKEVSLVVGSVIASGCSYSWWKYVWGSTKTKIKKALADKRLISFFRYIIIGYACIAGHQLMEFFAIYTGSNIVYKIGLITSISAMYFFMKGLEILTKINFGSKIFVVIIALVGLGMFLNDMTFENYHFWVRGHSHIIWASAWMILFIYWNVCVFYVRKISPVHENKRLLLWATFAILNISFLLSLGYAFLSAFINKAGIVCSRDILTSFNVLQDSPSV